jgi:hypothetical protein
MGNTRLNKPVMSMADDLDGAGYWLVAQDGASSPSATSPSTAHWAPGPGRRSDT